MAETIRLLHREDILGLTRNSGPKIVLSDGIHLLNWGISRRTGDPWSHAMWQFWPGAEGLGLGKAEPAHERGPWVATQGVWYRKRPIDEYMVDGKGRELGVRLKFWYNPEWTAERHRIIRTAIAERLNDPWFKRFYDFPGVLVGQLLGLRFLQSSFRYYCSEDVGRVLRLVEPEFRMKWPSPGDINRWCRANPQMVMYGIYDRDLERRSLPP